MGSSSSSYQPDPNFNPQIYTSQGVPLNEVLQYKKTFDSLKDSNYHKVSVEKIQELYGDSYDRKFLDQALYRRDYITFDEFFKINSQIVRTRKMQFPDMEVDGLEPNAQWHIANKEARNEVYSNQYQQYPQQQFKGQQYQQQMAVQSMPYQQPRYY